MMKVMKNAPIKATQDDNVMPFMRRLRLKAEVNWEKHYLDFERLQNLLDSKDYAAFDEYFRSELMRVLDFFMDQQNNTLEKCQMCKNECSWEHRSLASPSRTDLSAEMVRLMEFAHLNMEGFRELSQAGPRASLASLWLPMQNAYRCEFLNHALREVQVQRPPTSTRPKVVVFDKDGTLVSFSGAWGPWVEQRVNLVTERAGPFSDVEAVKQKLYATLGYVPADQSVLGEGALLAFANNQTQAEAITRALVELGTPENIALAAAQEAWLEQDSGAFKGPTKPVCDNVLNALRELQDMGIHIGVVTTDGRSSCLEDLRDIGVTELIDDLNASVVCGDDDMPAKPHPAGLLQICQSYGCLPSEAWMVGDTRCDLLAGRAAGFGCVVGVRSGTGQEIELQCSHGNALASVDIILDNVGQIGDLLRKAPVL